MKTKLLIAGLMLSSSLAWAQEDPAGMGVERMARLFTPFYKSRIGKSDAEMRWVQVDLGKTRKIDSVKVFPMVGPWGSPFNRGFPVKFKIEAANDFDFKSPGMIADCTTADYPEPKDRVCVFPAKDVTARYVRLTATHLREKQLCLSKIMVMAEGRDIAEGCQTADSDYGIDTSGDKPMWDNLSYWVLVPESGSNSVHILTRPARPDGEGVVTDNPGNIIPHDQWKPVPYKAQTPIRGVQLGEGLFKAAVENNARYLLLSFTNDELLRNFLLKAGKPVKPLDPALAKFWFLELPGSEAGRFLMGAGNTLRWMEIAELRKRMNAIVDTIDESKEPDGYIMAYKKDQVFEGENGAYVRSWVTHGLLDAGYAGNTKAFALVRGFYDWFNTSRYLPEQLRRSGQGVQGVIPLTRTYFSPVGKPKEIEVVQRYFQQNFWMEQMARRDIASIWLYPYDRPHNYLITAIEPYMDMYRATGAKKYLDAVEGAWDLYKDNWIHVGGSIAICESEPYPPKSYLLHSHTGELCGSVFWAYLNQRFHLLNPENEKYVAEIEKSIYNNAIANQVGAAGIRYTSCLVDHKDSGTPHWHHCMNTCCEGQGTRMLGALPEFIYSVAGDGLYVDLYAPSTIKFDVKNESMGVKMETGFPYKPDVLLSIVSARSVEAKIRVRIPSWAAGKMPVMVNGRKAATGKPGSYVVLNRKWSDGDKIRFTLPMGFKVSKYEGSERDPNNERYALEYGPILMGVVSYTDQPDGMKLKLDPCKLAASLSPIPEKPLHFSIAGNDDFKYVPYFEIQDEEFSSYPVVND